MARLRPSEDSTSASGTLPPNITPLPTPAVLPPVGALLLLFVALDASWPRLPVPPSEFPLPCTADARDACDACDAAILCCPRIVAHPLLPTASATRPATMAGAVRQRRCLVRRAGEAPCLRSSCT